MPRTSFNSFFHFTRNSIRDNNIYILFSLYILIVFSSCSSVSQQTNHAIDVVFKRTNGPVYKTLVQNKSKFERCAKESISVQTGARQQIEVVFTIEFADSTAFGRVNFVQITQMKAPDPDLYDCVIAQIKTLQFPPAKAKVKKVQISHSIFMSSQKQ